MVQIKSKFLTSLLAMYDSNPELKMEVVKFIYHFPSLKRMECKNYGSIVYHLAANKEYEFKIVETEFDEFNHRMRLEKKQIKTGKVQELSLYSAPILSKREAKENQYHGARAYKFDTVKNNEPYTQLFCKMAEYKNEHKRVNNNLVFALSTESDSSNFIIFNENNKTVQSVNTMNKFFEIEGGTAKNLVVKTEEPTK